MTAPVTHADVYTDFQGLSELRSRAKDNSEESLREVAGQFEALFIQMMLKSMRDANLGEGLLDNDHTKTYQAMFDKQIAIDLSKNQGLGLAEMMVRQLSRSGGTAATENELPRPVSPEQQVLIGPVRQRATAVLPTANPRQTTSSADWNPDSPESFVKELWPHARRTAARLGVKPEALLAQAALETGWGKHMIKGTDGRNSFNMFGIKADARWQGERVTTETVEFRDGLMRKERANFRAYASPEHSFSDYAAFLESNPRYREALDKAGDGASFAHALSEAGYATDPEYARKIKEIMSSPRLLDAVDQIKESGLQPLS